jgi:hypothetical protein
MPAENNTVLRHASLMYDVGHENKLAGTLRKKF